MSPRIRHCQCESEDRFILSIRCDLTFHISSCYLQLVRWNGMKGMKWKEEGSETAEDYKNEIQIWRVRTVWFDDVIRAYE